MKKAIPLFFAKALTLGVVTVGLLPFMAQPSHAEQDRFYCGQVNGTPTTMMRTPRQEVPLVMWLTRAFGSRWTPENRCDHVSQELQAAYRANQKFLTVGKKNDHDIICATKVSGGNCERQILTIPKTANPGASLDTLEKVRLGLTSAALLNRPHVRSNYKSDSDGWNGEFRPYLNLDQLRREIDKQ
jgi:hypothetical protein